MIEMLRKFEQVQELDLMIDRILAAKAEFPKRLAQFETEIRTQTAKSAELKKKIEELDKTHRQQKGALELNEERTRRAQDRMSAVKNNDEYQALQKELDSLKKSTLAITESEKKILEDLQKLQGDLKTAETSLKAASDKRDQERAKIDQEEGGITKELSDLQSRRKESAQGINARYLSAYERVRTGRGGVGVVPVINGVCKGCNMHIPPQLYVEIQRMTEIHTCPSCRRLLMFKDPKAQQSQDAGARA